MNTANKLARQCNIEIHSVNSCPTYCQDVLILSVSEGKVVSDVLSVCTGRRKHELDVQVFKVCTLSSVEEIRTV